MSTERTDFDGRNLDITKNWSLYLFFLFLRYLRNEKNIQVHEVSVSKKAKKLESDPKRLFFLNVVFLVFTLFQRYNYSLMRETYLH